MSSPLVVNGVTRGSVLDIKNDNGGVLIEASINGIDDLKEDASAEIKIEEITGGKKIDIFPGTSNKKFKSNMIIAGNTPPDIGDLVAIIGKVSGEAVSIVRKIDTIASAGTDLIRDGQFVSDLKLSAQNAREISSELNTLIASNSVQLEKTLDDLSRMVSTLKNSVDKNEPKLSSLIDNLELTVNDARSTLNKADRAIVSADSLMAGLTTITSDIRNGKGLASKIIYDEEFSKKLEKTLLLVESFIIQVQKHGINTNVSIGRQP